MKTSILIVGGGVGGCAAAMAATALGHPCVLTEPTRWLGGQLTSQAVPPDEHPWIESFGCTARYRRFREGVRRYYRAHQPLTLAAREQVLLNPGLGNVSKLCHEPRVALAVIEQMLMPAITRGLLHVLLEHEPVAAQHAGQQVHSVTLQNLRTGGQRTIEASYVLDATELGDLLPLTSTDYVSGAESRDETGELHALDGPAQPDDVQAITWCFPVAFDPAAGASHVQDPPPRYDFFRNHVPQMTPAWTGRQLSWENTHPVTLAPRTHSFDPTGGPRGSNLWYYRRIVAAEHYQADQRPHDVTLVNWPQNDYWLANLIDQPAQEVARILEDARQLSLSLFYWMQTEAPRPDGGQGWPGLYLRPDLTGTDDGLAMAPYIRESRRIRARFTVTEQHVGTEARQQVTAAGAMLESASFEDSVGVGCYRIDLHPSTGGRNYIDVSSLPFQIPLGSLIPRDRRNLLAACKNLGVTHITNGCYRLQPVEWNIGEAAGLLAAHCLSERVEPHQIADDPARVRDLQKLLTSQGIELDWPRNLRLRAM